MQPMELSGLPDIAGFLSGAKRPLLVLVGPTASGKTACAILIAHEGKGGSIKGKGIEIINADSRQLYRHLDIGTAKIRNEEMCGVPHHLIDVLDPKEEVTAAWFKREAERMIAEIHARGNIPFLVGGSMLYVSAIIDNLAFVATTDTGLRAKLSKRLQDEGAAVLYAELQKLDPEGALSIDPRNEVYLLRALEVCLTTGMRLEKAKKKNPSPYDLLIVGIDPPREELHRRITQRVHAMFAAGWVEEVQSLLAKGYSADDPGMLSHGYREIATALQDHSPEVVKADWELQERIAASSRQYAKRQMTWWRPDPRIRWFTPQAANRS
ncbi:MAG: tRNA (adenosine(37)-N6)-dimethylallyltransferase MiaA [Candidatus Peribacter sp.]|nr:tRNA (adenosine(37)-N6)-dimethylallyltransferase MiaA [Candidatus Peribacter sp.]